jgi:hypothetical protein
MINFQVAGKYEITTVEERLQARSAEVDNFILSNSSSNSKTATAIR